MKRPNIILILCDQFRGDILGPKNLIRISTPNFDALAARGTSFSHAYSAVPSCIPARAILFTGQNQWHSGILGMGNGQGPIPNDYPHTLAGELTKGGYRTHLVGKGHFNPQSDKMGFESSELDESGRMPDSEYRRWFASQVPADLTPDDHGVDWNSWHSRPWHTEERLHPTAWTMSRALDFLSTRELDRPFFLNISFARPHSPYVPPEYYFNQYRNGKLQSAVVGGWAHIHEAPPAESRDPNAWRGQMSTEEIHHARAGYFGEISFLDCQIGRLLCWMQKRMDRETKENTWIVFTSDHGDMLGDHNLWRKTYAYEGSARIPLLVVPPQEKLLPLRPVAEEVTELRDVMPTILDIAGLASPSTVDGRSLVPLLTKEPDDWRLYIQGEHCACYHPDQEMQYVTNGRRKFIWFPRTQAEQFFDLEIDPDEKDNLIENPRYHSEVARWRGFLIQELEQRECGWVVDGGLLCPDERPLISPYQDIRWTGIAAS